MEPPTKTPTFEREPCPDRILDDVGIGFAMGSAGGSLYHFLSGLKNSPRGERFVGGTQAVRMKTPALAGSFAVWSGLFSAFDCSMVYLRRKEDPWNSIIAGAATSGFLRMRGGLRVAAASALAGGVLFALIEGANIMVRKMESVQPQPPIFPEDTTSSGLFKREEKKKKSDDGVKTVILESDAPIPPTFEFKS